MAGRQDFKLHTGNVIDATVDGAVLSYGKDVKLTGYVGKAADSGTWDNLGDATITDAMVKYLVLLCRKMTVFTLLM